MMTFREWYFANECKKLPDNLELNEDAITTVLTNIFKTIAKIVTTQEFKEIIKLFFEYKDKNYDEIDHDEFDSRLDGIFTSLFDKTIGKKIDKMFESKSNIRKTIQKWKTTIINAIKLLGFNKILKIIMKIKS